MFLSGSKADRQGAMPERNMPVSSLCDDFVAAVARHDFGAIVMRFAL